MSVYEQPRAKPSSQLPDSVPHFEVRTDYHQCYAPQGKIVIEVSVALRAQSPASIPVLLWYRDQGRAMPWPLEAVRLRPTESGYWFDHPTHLTFDIKQLPVPLTMPNGESFNPDRFHRYLEERNHLHIAPQEIYLARLAKQYVQAKFTWFPASEVKPTPHCLLILTCDPPEAQKWSVVLRLPAELETLIRPR